MFKRLAIIGLLLMLSVGVVGAQDNADECVIDLTLVNDLMALADSQAAEGLQADAVATLALAREKLDMVLSNCEIMLEADTLVETTDALPPVTGVALTQSISVAESFFGDAYSVRYPADWFAQQDEGVVIIANEEHLMEESVYGTPEISANQFAVVGFMFGEDVLSMLGLDVSASPVDVGQTFIDYFFTYGGTDGMNFDEVEAYPDLMHPTAILSGELTIDGEASDGALVVVQFGETFFFMLARYDGDFNDVLRAIATSASLGGSGDL